MLELSEVKKDVTWEEAMDYAKELGEGWRIPSKQELQIIEASPRSKEFATEGFFWASSLYAHDTNYAWTISFSSGYVSSVHTKSASDSRCVRGSFEDLLTWCFGTSRVNCP
jgi:hypothetical protein